MGATYAQHFSTRATPQTEKIPGSKQVPNEAGGFSFAVDKWTRLDRFLVLGNEGGSYYASEKKMTVENATGVQACLAEDGLRTVARIVEISKAGRAPKNDPAIFALAIAAGTGNPATKKAAMDAMPEVCRIGTHLFQFAESVQAFRGWGRTLRKGIAAWYSQKDAAALSYQAIKYQNRNGWSHRDLLRLCHVKPSGTDDLSTVLNWIVKGWPEVGEQPHDREALRVVWAFERAKRAKTWKEIVPLIREYNLPRECVPTQFLTDPVVWEALLEKMPLTAMIRNLATMTRVGLLSPMSAGIGKVLAELANTDRLRKSRVHPVAILAALLTYKQGHGERGSNTWQPVAQVVDALDGAFYSAFGNIEPTGKRWLLGLDVSGSMQGTMVAGIQGMSAVMAESAMALITAATEPNHLILAFDTVIKNVPISPRQRLDDVTHTVNRLVHGGTDCALPMIYATQNKIHVDAFAIFTDSQTWAGQQHPIQALKTYRQAMGIPAKLIVVAMCANQFTLTDEEDAGSLNVAGMDTAVPSLIADFVR